jgi:hypothetical protein
MGSLLFFTLTTPRLQGRGLAGLQVNTTGPQSFAAQRRPHLTNREPNLRRQEPAKKTISSLLAALWRGQFKGGGTSATSLALRSPLPLRWLSVTLSKLLPRSGIANRLRLALPIRPRRFLTSF